MLKQKIKLIVLGGFAGAGKTTIARRLAADFNFPFFNPDDFNAGLMPTLNKDFHEISPIAYPVMWHVLKKNIAMGTSSVLDANMCSQRTWETLDDLKKELPHVHIVSIILECDLEVHRQRVEKRRIEEKDHLNLGGDTWDTILHKYEFIRKLERPDIIRVDANGSIDEVYKKVLDILHISL